MDSIDSLMDIELDRSQHSSVTDETLSTAAAPVSNQGATPVTMERSDWSFSTSTSSTADVNDEDDDEDYVNDADDDEENADDDERNDVNEEDRNDYDDDDDSESIDIEDDINEPDRDDNESTDLIIAVDFKSPVVIMPRSSADGAWSTSSPISPESTPLLSHAGVADLTESSQSAPVVSVGAISALTSTVPSSASAGSPRRCSNVFGSSTADSYSIVPVPASSTVPASNAAGISAASQASAADSGRRKSGCHHRQTKQLQSQQQQDHQRQTPIISGCLPTSTTESRGSTTAHQHQPHQRQESSTANPSHHQPSAQQQQQSIDAGSAWSTARAAVQFADSLRRRTDSLTQKCLRLQVLNESPL
jgi:hypothetical protein